MSIFSSLKEKFKVEYREKSWEDFLLSVLGSMFEYNGLPVNTEFIELLCNMYGECAIWETKDGFGVSYCQRSGKPNVNGLGSDLICTTWNGECVTFRNFENPESPDFSKVVYIRNNMYAMPDSLYQITADTLSDIDKSIKHIIVNSRYTPIAIAKDEKTRVAIQSAIDSNNSGDIQVVLSSNILDGDTSAYVLNITDVNASDKIQYLYKAKDDTLRHFYNRIGMEICGASKMAQQTVAEVNAGCNSHEIVPNSRLNEREKAVTACNEKFGWSGSVTYSEPWRKEFAISSTKTDKKEGVVENAESIQN